MQDETEPKHCILAQSAKRHDPIWSMLWGLMDRAKLGLIPDHIDNSQLQVDDQSTPRLDQGQ